MSIDVKTPYPVKIDVAPTQVTASIYLRAGVDGATGPMGPAGPIGPAGPGGGGGSIFMDTDGVPYF